MSFFNRNKKVFGMTFMVRMIVTLLTVIVLGVSGTVLMADWTGDTTDVYTMGNVGIGVTSPTSELDVFGKITLNSNPENYINLINPSRINNTAVDVTEVVGRQIDLYAYDDIALRTGTSSYDDIHIFTGGLQRMIIKGDGYIGIGTTNPEDKLEVRDGKIGVFSDDEGIDRGLTIGYSKSEDQGVIRTSNTDTGMAIRIGDSTEVFRINPNGNVGIGTDSPAYKLDVAGTTSSNLYRCSSDARYKKNVSPYENALEKVLGLRGVSYFWKTDEYKERNFSKDKQIGFIAQEVEKVIPELVYTDDKGYKTMSYDRLTVVLVQAMKEIKTEKDTEIAALQKENEQLKQEIASLKSMNQRIAAIENALKLNQQIAAKGD